MRSSYEIVIDNPEIDPWALLAGSVIREVVKDLHFAIKHNLDNMAKECKKWLLSDYGQLLSLGQGEYIISEAYKLYKEV